MPGYFHVNLQVLHLPFDHGRTQLIKCMSGQVNRAPGGQLLCHRHLSDFPMHLPAVHRRGILSDTLEMRE